MCCKSSLRHIVLPSVCVWLFCSPIWAQQISSLDRGWANDMMQTVASDIRKNYYDPKLHGLDWEARVADAKQKIDKADSMNMALSYISAAVDSLNDSHTYFFPPGRARYYDYGWHYQMIGDRCYVTQVRPGSDAALKGVKTGDEILTINGFLPERSNLWKMNYVLNVLRPQSSLHVLFQMPDTGKSKQLDVSAKVTQLKRSTDLSWNWIGENEEWSHYMRARYEEVGDELMIIKLPVFAFSNAEIAGVMGKARKHKALILDLRGNGGGSVESLKDLVGALFEKETKIADRVTRKETKAMLAKPQHNIFTGKLMVLVDGESASASELLARLVQLEKRGMVLGDRSSGSVMESKGYRNNSSGYQYGESITEANLIMTDGLSLEHVGITPDELILPKAADLVAGRDPVLARAAAMAGVAITPEAAGKMFPYLWPPAPQ